MTPQVKAEVLVNKYLLATPVGFNIDDAKKCALIAVDEIIEALLMCYSEDHVVDYWKQVKQEIEKI
jgi:hypothetical protein